MPRRPLRRRSDSEERTPSDRFPEPVATEPVATEPVATEPVATEPGVREFLRAPAPMDATDGASPRTGRRRGRRDGELTIDELAAETGMTVRNVRAYSSRGLLPPPRLEGRTGYYGPDHLARLTLVREMLDQGYTLAAAEKLITAAPGSGTQALGLYHALMSPWEGVEAEVFEPRALAREAGIAFDPAFPDRLVTLGLGVELDDGTMRIDNPTLVRAGLRVISTGVPVEKVFGLVPELVSHADAVADLFVTLIRDSLWVDFVEAGMPARQWTRMSEAFEEIIPLAGQALLAAFQESLGKSVEAAMRDGLLHVDDED